MAKKLLFVFAGTGVDAQETCDFYEDQTSTDSELFSDDVIRIYFNGCQDSRIGGKLKLLGYLSPDIDVAAGQIRKAFSKMNGVVQFNLADLRREFGDAIIIKPNKDLNDPEEVNDITLNGFSRGGVTAFSTARALDDLDVPISILAEDPVPGDSRSDTHNSESIYRKNFDLSNCRNIVRGEVLLGTYSKANSFLENKWLRQMAAIFPKSSNNYLFAVPKRHHCEFNRRATNYTFGFLLNRGLIQQPVLWKEDRDISYLIPDVEQQKFHSGVVGRTQYLPSYKESILRKLEKKYTASDRLCPITEDSKFKMGQALLVLHTASMSNATQDNLEHAILVDADKAKGLREFIIQMDSIIQYSKALDALTDNHLCTLSILETNLYNSVAAFYTLDKPTIKQREAFSQGVHDLIKTAKAGLPSKVSSKLSELSDLLLKENTLVHTHLVKFIDDDETFKANILTADRCSYDTSVTNALELAQKLFYNSERQRSVVFQEITPSLKTLINNAVELADIASFLKPKELKVALMLVGDKIKTFDDVLLLMNALPRYEHRKTMYHAMKTKFNEMHPTSVQITQLMEYLSNKKCKEVFESLKSQLGSIKQEGDIEPGVGDNISMSIVRGC